MLMDTTLPQSLFRLLRALKRAMRQGMAGNNHPDLGPVHVIVLQLIAKTPDCTANSIALWMQRDKAQITRLLKELITAHYIEKSTNPDDKRSQFLRLTATGKETLGVIGDVEAGVMEQLVRNISPEELEQFMALADRMASNLEGSHDDR